MPHVGKYCPWLMKNQVVADEYSLPFYRPPSRKMQMHVNTLGNTGTWPTSWAGVNVISSIGDYLSADSRITTYTFTHPSISSYTMEVQVDFYQVPPTPSSVLLNRWHVNFIARDGFTQVGRYDTNWDYGSVFVNNTAIVAVINTWPIRAGLPTFQNMGLQLRAANWAEQPEYHPYRH